MNNPVFKIERVQQKVNRIVWNKFHDVQLSLLVEKNKGKNWKKIAETMKRLFDCSGITAKKCRERWCNCTNPNLAKGALNESEQILLLVYHNAYGNKWASISREFPNRNSIKIKNDFTNLVLKIARKIQYGNTEGDISIFHYIQNLYITILINELICIQKFEREISNIIPIHIYEKLKVRNITSEQCIYYINKATSEFLAHHKDRIAIKDLTKLETITNFQGFLYKILNTIRETSLNNLSDKILLNIVKSSVLDQLSLNCSVSKFSLIASKLDELASDFGEDNFEPLSHKSLLDIPLHIIPMEQEMELSFFSSPSLSSLPKTCETTPQPPFLLLDDLPNLLADAKSSTKIKVNTDKDIDKDECIWE